MYEFIGNYIFLLPLYIILEILICTIYRKKQVQVTKGFVIGWQLFAFLLTTIFSITGTAGICDIGNYGDSLIRLSEINLIPIIHWGVGDLFGLSMNLILFVPVGIAIPLLYKSGTSFWRTAGAGFQLSLLIECSQLFNRRATDIDDLIMNTLGTMIGYAIYLLLFKKVTLFQVDNTITKKEGRYDTNLHILLIIGMYWVIGCYLVRRIWIYLSM